MLVVGIGAAITGSSWYLNTRMARRKAGELFLEISRRAVQRTQSQVSRAVPAVETLRNLMSDDLRHADSDEQGNFTGVYRAGAELRVNRSTIKQGKTELVEQVIDPSGAWKPRRHEAD